MRKFFANYGMILVLILLCAFFSVATIQRESATGETAASNTVTYLSTTFQKSDRILVAGAARKESADFATNVATQLREGGFTSVEVVNGSPRDLLVKLRELSEDESLPPVLVGGGDVTKWTVWENVAGEFPGVETVVPEPRIYSGFLKKGNLVAVVDRIVVIAVIAIGMTLVILTGGIDLSVGSLLALAAVISTLIMKWLGGLDAPAWVVWFGFLGGTASCGLIGLMGGLLVSWFRIAPFITTLAIMMMARGFAYILTGGFSIYQVPESLTWLGQGKTIGIPNTVIILIILYVAAHLFMSHTRFGRYIYAVGGNEEAARLSGVPVKWMLTFVYLVGGLTAGFAGCIQASQLNSGAPGLGKMFELYVIAAVVVGGTSLSGGSGKIFGTLIGAFIISVIQNGMNLLGFESYTQTVVLGAVILVSVLIDKIRNSGGLVKLLRG